MQVRSNSKRKRQVRSKRLKAILEVSRKQAKRGEVISLEAAVAHLED